MTQPKKVKFSILVIEFGMVIEVRLLQPEKTEPSIAVTEFGIVIEVK